jgi:hypothetical protein
MLSFDPYNINLIRFVPYTGCLVFIHATDVVNVHRIPSLLRLKRNLNVAFVTFQTLEDIQKRAVSPVFPRAGLVVMHSETLLACKPGTNQTLLLVACFVRF